VALCLVPAVGTRFTPKIVGVKVLKGVDMRETSDRIKDFRSLVPPSGVLDG
jgi:hypothetical protein